MAAVIFDPAEFRLVYPQFTADRISDAQLQRAFDTACLLWGNPDESTIPETERAILLDLLTCHLATLALWGAGGQAGPVTAQSASTSGLNLSFQIPQTMGRAYYGQTPCGQSFWAATLKYRIGGKYYPPRIAPHPWG
jgi:hypothetical protein